MNKNRFIISSITLATLFGTMFLFTVKGQENTNNPAPSTTMRTLPR